MNANDTALFAPDADRAFGQRVGDALGVTLSEHEERDFEDGEHKIRPLESVRGRDVFVVQSLYSDQRQTVNDKLCRLLFFLGSLRDDAAKSVTAVVPYLCYSRKDRQTKPRDPITTRYIACLFEAVGVDRVVTLDVHNLAAFQNAFRCQSEHLEAKTLFASHFVDSLRGEKLVVVSPDAGGVKRAEQFRQALGAMLDEELPLAFMEKQRSEGVVSGQAVVGDVEGRAAVILDDLISTGTTMLRAAKACRDRGATAVYAAATHGLFVGDASDVFAEDAIDRLIITDTIPPFRLADALVQKKVTVLPAAPFIAEAIRRLHESGSLTELQETNQPAKAISSA